MTPPLQVGCFVPVLVPTTLSHRLFAMYYRLFILSLIPFVLFGCSSHKQDDRLTHIADIVSETPHSALAALDSINYSSLTDADQYFYDFLEIKAKDKAYITHTSDSLVLRVIDYYSSHNTLPVYPEALYYGGRVYSDLGDYPTALRYFQLSLDHITSDPEDLDLKNRALAQTGRLLTSLGLFQEAVPYIEAAIEINRQTNDTIGLIYNLQLLGGTHLRAENYSLAEKYLKESIANCNGQAYAHPSAISHMYLAATKYAQNHIDSARYMIRPVIDEVPHNVRNGALAYAARIYLKAGLPDSAYIFAKQLIAIPNTRQHHIGYLVLLSPQLRKFIPSDTLDRYIADYSSLLASLYDENDIQLSINQQSSYNYQLHDRRRAAAEQSNEHLWQWVTGCLFTIVVMGTIILFLKNRDKKHIIELQRALVCIGVLEQELAKSSDTMICRQESNNESNAVNHDVPIPLSNIDGSNVTEKDLRARLKDKLMTLYQNGEGGCGVSPIILQSQAYLKLMELLKEEKTIKEEDGLWNDIEQIVLECSPKFRINLSLLTCGKLTLHDLHTALLIKCGIKPSQMTVLLGRSNGAIISRRESLCLKVLDEKLGVKVIDSIIRLL